MSTNVTRYWPAELNHWSQSIQYKECEQTFLKFNTQRNFGALRVFKKICKYYDHLPIIKVSLQNLKSIFPVILQIFDLKTLYWKNKILDLHKT